MSQAVEACRREHLFSAEAVIQRTRTLAAIEATTCGRAPRPSEELTAPRVEVPLPDLDRFNLLLDGGAAEGPARVSFA